MQAKDAPQQGTPIQAVIFDLDGVLMDSEWIAFLAWREVVEAHGGTLEDAVFEGMTGKSDMATAEYVVEQSGLEIDKEKYIDWTWQRMLDQMTGDIESLPGAKSLVSALAQRGLPLAIASNGFTGYIDNALRGLGLGTYFPVRVGADQVDHPKPAPDVYLVAAERLGADPTRCLAVEDSLVGMQAAAAAGLRVIAVPDRRTREKPFPHAWSVYASLVDVEKDLERILR